MSDPPGCVRGELEPLAPIEFLDRSDEPEISLLDEVQQVEAPTGVPLGNGDNKPQIAPNELDLGLVSLPDVANEFDPLLGGDERIACQFQLSALTALDDPGEANFILCREQIMGRYRLEVKTDGVPDRRFPCSACHTTPVIGIPRHDSSNPEVITARPFRQEACTICCTPPTDSEQ